MLNIFTKKRKKAGLPPGTLVYTGNRLNEKVRITVIDYNETLFQEKEITELTECSTFKDTPTVTWVNVDGVHNISIIEQIGKYFDIHPLIMEDIANIGQRPKIEDMDRYMYIVLKMLDYKSDVEDVVAEQMSIIIGQNFIISFQETEGDIFGAIRDRIRLDRGRIRRLGPDYLAYSFIDAIVDNYFLILENIGERFEFLEEELLYSPDIDTLKEIQRLKNEMMFLRKSVWPLREVISRMERVEGAVIQKSTRIYLRDTYDHTIQVIDAVETFRDMLSSMLEIYLSSVSNRMNEVMKVLTVISTIFMPLTFLVGVYGMNFKHMPEFDQTWAYPLLWCVMLGIALCMLFYFRRRRWI